MCRHRVECDRGKISLKCDLGTEIRSVNRVALLDAFIGERENGQQLSVTPSVSASATTRDDPKKPGDADLKCSLPLVPTWLALCQKGPQHVSNS